MPRVETDAPAGVAGQSSPALQPHSEPEPLPPEGNGRVDSAPDAEDPDLEDPDLVPDGQA